MSNLLAQGKEIKRLKKEDERRQKELEELEQEKRTEEKERAIKQFEKSMVGLEGDSRKSRKDDSEEVDRIGGRGVKRKFELDEDEMLKIAKEERTKARKDIEDEKVCHLELFYQVLH